MGIENDIISAMGSAQDALREVFLPATTRCFLLKRKPHSENFVAVLELTSGWFIKWNEYRGQLVLMIASTISGIADSIAQTSFFAYGVPDSQSQLEVFGIDPDRRDVVSPVGNSPFWKLYGAKDARERYTLV